MTKYLSTDEVCGKLARAGVDEATVGKIFASRQQPQNLDDPDQKFAMVVESGDLVYLVIYRFGLGKPIVKQSPLDEGGPDWRPRFLSVEGPFAGRGAAEPLDDFVRRISDTAKGFTNG